MQLYGFGGNNAITSKIPFNDWTYKGNELTLITNYNDEGKPAVRYYYFVTDPNYDQAKFVVNKEKTEIRHNGPVPQRDLDSLCKKTCPDFPEVPRVSSSAIECPASIEYCEDEYLY